MYIIRATFQKFEMEDGGSTTSRFRSRDVTKFDILEEMYEFICKYKPEDIVGPGWDENWTVVDREWDYMLVMKNGKIEPKYRKMLKYRSIDAV